MTVVGERDTCDPEHLVGFARDDEFRSQERSQIGGSSQINKFSTMLPRFLSVQGKHSGLWQEHSVRLSNSAVITSTQAEFMEV